MRPAVPLLAFLLAPVAGCLGGPAEAHAGAPPAPEPATLSGLLAGSDCRGVKTSGSFKGPQAAGSAPPGWEPSPSAENALYYFIAECGRLAVGPHERPVALVIESHQRFRAPDGCLEGLPGLPFMVSAVWVSDAEVARLLAERHGLPATWAAIERRDAAPGGPSGSAWSWAVAGGDPSVVEAWETGTVPSRLTGGGRLFWPHPGTGGIAASDLLWDLGTHADRNPVQLGEMSEPTLWSRGFLRQYVGLGDVFSGSHVQADYRAYGDYRCAQPAS